MGNLGSPVCLLGCFWEVGENRRTWRKPMQTQGEHVNLHTDNNLSLELNWGSWGCEAATLCAGRLCPQSDAVFKNDYCLKM